jgi:hypothetical protein
MTHALHSTLLHDNTHTLLAVRNEAAETDGERGYSAGAGGRAAMRSTASHGRGTYGG